MKIALWSGVIAASPVLFYQLWAFLLPAFTRHERRGCCCLFPCRRCCFRRDFFSFFIVLPQGLRFFMSFAMESVQPLWSLAGYLDFAVLMVLPFGVIFNLRSLGSISSNGARLVDTVKKLSKICDCHIVCNCGRHHADDGYDFTVIVGGSHDHSV